MVMRLLIVLLLLSTAPAQATVNASVDKNPVLAGEVLTLTISSDSGDDPDLSPLEADFQILRQSSSSQFQMINGKTRRSHDWVISLRPKRLGTLLIPALTVGNDRTQALQISVRKPDPVAGETPEAYIEQTLSKSDVYVREQTVLTARLYVRSDLVSGSFSDPRSPNAVLEQLGEQTESQELRGTQRYRVIERRYAVFAEQSGALSLEPALFNGEVADPRARRSVFGGGTRAVYAAGDALTLTVKAQASTDTSGYWLPSSQVELSEELRPAQGPWPANEPLTRTITLRVRGQLHTQLPDLELTRPTGAQSYTETPTDQTGTDGQDLIAVRKYSMAVIPNQAGVLQLPEVSIGWWDVGADQARISRLAARELNISAALRPMAGSAPVAMPTTAPVADDITATANPTTAVIAEPHLWIWQSLALAALAGWLGTVVAWWFQQRRSSQPGIPTDPAPKIDLKKTLNALATGDAPACRKALLQWAKVQLPRVHSLQQLQTHAPADAARALAALDAALYGNGGTFERDVLIRFVRDFQYAEHAERDSALPPLYPE